MVYINVYKWGSLTTYTNWDDPPKKGMHQGVFHLVLFFEALFFIFLVGGFNQIENMSSSNWIV